MNNNNPTPTIATLAKLADTDHLLSQRISRSITLLVKAGNISGAEIEALAAIAAGYDLLTAPARTARRQAAFEAEKSFRVTKVKVHNTQNTVDNRKERPLPTLLDMTQLEQNFLDWWTRLQHRGQQRCMPIVLDVAVEGLSLTKVGEKRHCDKRTARSRLLLGLGHYLAVRAERETQDDEQGGGNAGSGGASKPGESGSSGVEEALEPAAALRRAIGLAGGQSAFARQIGTNQQNIFYWLKKGSVSVKFAPAIEKATGVAAGLLRPDIFGGNQASKMAAHIGGGILGEATSPILVDAGLLRTGEKQRCPLCMITLTEGVPKTPCYRKGCDHAVPEGKTLPTFGASSLGGDDYSVV